MGVTWRGLDRLQENFTQLAGDVSAEAATILEAGATTARSEIAAAYPHKTGALRRGLKLTRARGVVGMVLKQRAPHGWIYEHGTKVRENQAGQNRGRMKENPTFEPIADRYRTMALFDVMDRLYAHGAARVEGDPNQE